MTPRASTRSRSGVDRSSPATIAERAAPADPRTSARRAGLRYTTDSRPGITRRRAGRGFSYRVPGGATVRDRATLGRIRSLAIPPAWNDVWICPEPAGHLQATGRDARGRKQYRYHPRWRLRRNDTKFERILAFARLLPRIRRRCDRDLAGRSLTREKVLAAMVRLLELTLIRVGSDEYARLNRSFGLATLRGRHVSVRGETIRFRFRGKSGRQHDVDLRDRRLAGIIRRCQELPGQDLFQYVDADGNPHDVTSDDVNAYLREAAGADVSTRDFRVWAGTVVAYRALSALEPADDDRGSRRNVVGAIRASADALGNTEAVARQSYVHPAVVDAYLAGTLKQARRHRTSKTASEKDSKGGDAITEAAVLALLESPVDSPAQSLPRRSPVKRRGPSRDGTT
jgi:DNA topoisomerase-1